MDLTYIKPPIASPSVVAVTTSASSATAVASTFITGLYKFQSDGDCWILFGGSDVADPDPTDTSSTGRCYKIPADQERVFRLGTNATYFKVITDATTSSTYLRWYFEQAG